MVFTSIFNALMSSCGTSQNLENKSVLEGKTSIHQFEYAGIGGDTIKFSEFEGKKILVVNTASKCGFTGQYEGLEKLHKEYSQKLIVVGFPSNNFGSQEPGSNEDIANFCKLNYGVSFPIATKSSVKGNDINPVMEWLTKVSGGGDIMWNFEKFLLDEKGQYIDRFRSMVKPTSKKIISKI